MMIELQIISLVANIFVIGILIFKILNEPKAKQYKQELDELKAKTDKEIAELSRTLMNKRMDIMELCHTIDELKTQSKKGKKKKCQRKN